MKKFILNDESKKNSYGFRVLTAGISLERFNSNPVALNNHSNHTKDVLGTWVETKPEQKLLTAKFSPDTKDPEGLEVVRKVDKNILKAASIGIMIEPENFQNINGELIVTKCELMEASIVAVPSNANSITVFSADGEKMSENEIKTLCLSLQTAKPFENQNHNTMKILLSHLQLAETATEAEILLAVKAIETKLTASETKYTELEGKYNTLIQAEKVKLQADYDDEIEAAQKDGRIDASQVPTFKELKAEAGLKVLKGLPKRKTVEEQMEEGKTGNEKKRAEFEKLNWDALHRSNKLATLKADFYDLYEQKFEEKFGHKPGEKK